MKSFSEAQSRAGYGGGRGGGGMPNIPGGPGGVFAGTGLLFVLFAGGIALNSAIFNGLFLS